MTDITHDEAVRLAHGLAAAVADNTETRVLFIKGPILEAQALRTKRTSADVDVLVDPIRTQAFCDALGALGWTDSLAATQPRVALKHATALSHTQWRCAIDVHRYFPGIFLSPQAAFERLWSERESQSIAGIEIPVPSRAASACIAALHALRAPGEERNVAELADVTRRVRDWPLSERERLRDVAIALRCDQPLMPMLESLGLAVPAATLSLEEARRWRLVRNEFHDLVIWFEAARGYRWHERCGLLWRKVMGDERVLRLTSPTVGTSVFRLRLRRFERIGRRLPRQVLAYVREQRASRRSERQ